MRRRTPRLREGEPEIHTNRWVLKLERASGEAGYFFGIDERGIVVLKWLDGKAQRFASRKEAERFARRLEKKYGLDIEEATPEEFVHPSTTELHVPDPDSEASIAVVTNERTGKRYLVLTESGEEISTDDLDDDIADMLVRILHKVQASLDARKQKRPSR